MVYRALIEQTEHLPLRDYAAAHSLPKNNGFFQKSVKELLQSSDKMMKIHLLGCDEKYKNGTASDYETFAEWERIMPLCVGTGTAALYVEEKRILGIDTAATPREAWQTVTEQPLLQEDLVTLYAVSDQTVNIVSELSNIVRRKEKSPLSYTEIFASLSEIIQEKKARKNKELHFIFDCNFDFFEAPNRYRAEQILQEKKYVENFNKNEKFLLSAQLLIDLILVAKQEALTPILHLRRWRTAEQLREFLDYLAAHRLLVGELRIGTLLDTDFKFLTVLCESLCDRISVHPELILLPSDFGTDIAQRLRSLASVYPLGGLRFGGIDTDAPLFWAGHRLFKEQLARLLSELCDTEEQAIYLAKSICEL